MALQLWNPDPHLRAGPAVEESFVLFINGTDRTINLYWIDWTGRQKFYHNLEPRRNIKANTFCSHPWVFRDSVTAERMQVCISVCVSVFKCNIIIVL